MKLSNSTAYSLSARDLTNHLSCKHLTELNQALTKCEIKPPDWYDPDLEKIQQLGLRHEQSYIKYLIENGLQVAELREYDDTTAFNRTISAMKDGADIIVQAYLQYEIWNGRADILKKVDKPSNLGNWSYEVIDTKLALNTKGSTVLQLCFYSELVSKIQGVLPIKMHVVKPGNNFEPENYTFTDFKAYYNLVKNQLVAKIETSDKEDTYPNPVPHCDICRWWKTCDTKRREDDHLSFVAGLSSLHRTELQRQDINTLTHFAEQEKPFKEKPQYGSEETY